MKYKISYGEDEDGKWYCEHERVSRIDGVCLDCDEVPEVAEE